MSGHVMKISPRGNVLEVSHEREMGLPLGRQDKTKQNKKSVSNITNTKCMFNVIKKQGRSLVGCSRK